MLFFIVTGVVGILTLRIAMRKRGVTNMQLKPYRYQVDSRRSRWANRQGF